MSQTFWETDAADEEQPGLEPQLPHHEEPQEELHEELQEEPEAEPVPLAVSADDFSALEERILRTVGVVKRERQLRAVAEERAAAAEAQLNEQLPVVDELKQEIRGLRGERDQIRQRVERLLTQLDALEL